MYVSEQVRFVCVYNFICMHVSIQTVEAHTYMRSTLPYLLRKLHCYFPINNNIMVITVGRVLIASIY